MDVTSASIRRGSMRRSHVLLQAIAAVGFIAGLPLAARADLPIYQIAITATPGVPGTGTPAPDGGVFTSFGLPVGDRETRVNTGLEPLWFEATTSNGISGVYVYDAIYNDYATLADTTMTVPQGGATFTGFSNLSSGNGELGFLATDSNGVQGVYAIGDFPLTLVVDNNTLTPSGIPYGHFQSISIIGNSTWGFPGGEIESEAGIYEFASFNTQYYALIGNTNTTPPGASGPFTSFGPISYKAWQDVNLEPGIAADIQAVCATADGVEGIYWGFDSSVPSGGGLPNSLDLVSLVKAGDVVPDSNGNPTAGTFTSFGNPVATSNEVRFTARYDVGGDDGQGIFSFGSYLDGSPSRFGSIAQLTRIVAMGQVAPDSGGAIFTGFGEINDDAFIASLSDGEKGLFTFSLLKVVETGDLIGGKAIADIELSPDGIGPLTFLVDFEDGSQGLYYYGVPEPASLCLFALPLLLLSWRRRDRSNSGERSPQPAIEPLEERRLLSVIGIDASQYGVSTNNTGSDNFTDLTNAVSTAASANAGVVYLPDGPIVDGVRQPYLTTSPIVIPSDVTLRGESANGTIIDYTGAAGDGAIEFSGPYDNGVQNLTVQATNGYGIYSADSGNSITLDAVNDVSTIYLAALNIPSPATYTVESGKTLDVE
jgi:hypothetical protein